MTPEDTIGRILVTEPLVQIAVALSGVLLLWYEIRDIRRWLNASSASTDPHSAINLCNDRIAVRAKVLAVGVMLIQLGLCLLLSGTQIVPAGIALGFFAILVFLTVIPASIYFMFWGAPAPVLRWLLVDLRSSATNSA